MTTQSNPDSPEFPTAVADLDISLDRQLALNVAAERLAAEFDDVSSHTTA